MVVFSSQTNVMEKYQLKNSYICPFCNEKFTIGIESKIMRNSSQEDHSLYRHIHLHGNPLHAMICYIDKNFAVRSIEVVKSIEIERKSETLQQFIQKWSYPF